MATTAETMLHRVREEVRRLIVSAAPATSAVVAGTYIHFGGTSVPTGYLLCDGSLVSRSTYATLFTAIGTTHGAGDGSTTFALPNAQGRIIFGQATSGTGSTLGGTFGAIDHTHDVNIGSITSSVESSSVRAVLAIGASNVADVSHTHTVDPPNTTSTTNNPPCLVGIICIKT